MSNADVIRLWDLSTEDDSQRHLTLVMTSAQVVEKSMSSQTVLLRTHPNDHTLATYDMTPGFKPFTQ